MQDRSVSHYQILERVGSGTMGVVYKARDERLGRLVALKFLPEHLGEREENKRRFIQEARSTSSLDHENLCTVYDIGETEEGQIFIAMPFYEGETLKDRIARGPLPVGEALDIAIQLGEGLAEAHAHGIVHRDLKPANVMITRAGRVKIVDFGLAKLLDEVSQTKTGATLGTVAYMSPEQAKGAEVDGRTDVWALGVVLYEMLTGDRPFGGDNHPAMLYSILNRSPEPPSQVAQVPGSLDGILEKALEKDLEKRYASASEMLADLRSARVQLGLASQEEISLVLPKIRRARLRRRVLMSVLLIAVIASGVFLLQLRRGEAEIGSGLAVLPLVNLTGDPSFDYLAEGLSATLTTKLAEISGLDVVSRSEVASVIAQYPKSKDDWAQNLGAAYLVEGQIQRENDQLRVSLNLVNAGTHSVWSHWDFNGDMQHLIGLQNEMAQALIQYFSIPLSFQERRRMARNPTDSARAYDQLMRGMGYFNKSKEQPDLLDLAIESFQSAVDLDPDFALAWAHLGSAHWAKYVAGHQPLEIEAARKAAKKATELDPNLPDAQIALAQTEAASGDMEQSMARIREMLKRTPNPVQAYAALSSNYERLGKVEQAITFRQAATQAEPDNWRAWFDLGALYARLGRFDEAKAAFEKSESRVPADVTAPQELEGAIALQHGQFNQALAIFDRVPRPIRSSVLASNIGTAYYYSNRPDKMAEAEKYYRLAVQLAPDDTRVRRNLGDLLMHVGQRQEALETYQKAVSLLADQLRQDPDNRSLKFGLAAMTAKANDCDQALALARDLEGHAVAGMDFHELATAYALCGDHEHALPALKGAIAHGIPASFIAGEDEFQKLKKLPEFRQLVSDNVSAN